MPEEYPFRISRHIQFKSSSLIIAWNRDSSTLGARVIDFLNKKLGGQEICEMELSRFFSFGGVAVEDNVIQFPECKLYACEKNNLLIFKSDTPQYEWYKFLNSIIDAAEHCAKVEEIYTIGGMVGLTAHTRSRELFAVFNSLEMKKRLGSYHLGKDMDYQTPSGQRPTLSSFLLWVAQKRGILGVNLWVPIPFYLVAVEDAKAQKIVLEFFDRRFNLGIDYKCLDDKIGEQNEKIARARIRSPEIDGSINKLEDNLHLSEEENVKLIKEIEKVFKRD